MSTNVRRSSRRASSFCLVSLFSCFFSLQSSIVFPVSSQLAMSNAFNSLLSLPDSSPPSSPLPTTVTLPDETAAGLAGEAQTTVAASSAGSVAAPDDPPVSNRQPAEDDLVQYADQVARRVRLRPAGQQELRGLVMVWTILTAVRRLTHMPAHNG